MSAARKSKKHSPRGGRLLPRSALVAGAVFVVASVVGFVIGLKPRPAPGASPYRAITERWCAEYNVNPDLASAVLEAESSGRPRAVSSADALGLMQLKMKTATAMAKEVGLKAPTREDLFTPAINIRLGVYYLSKHRKRFGEERAFTIAAYHAGPTCIDRLRRRRADLSAREVVAQLAPPATRVYVGRVLKYWERIAGERRRP